MRSPLPATAVSGASVARVTEGGGGGVDGVLLLPPPQPRTTVASRAQVVHPRSNPVTFIIPDIIRNSLSFERLHILRPKIKTLWIEKQSLARRMPCRDA